MAEKKQEAVLSDGDIELGLPSPDASDDEEIQVSSEIGITVPHFCNKLREQTRPLLSLSQGVPSPTKQLKENGNDKPKESKAKKRLFKGRQQPSSRVIEQRYGYVPNPRWPKPFGPYTKPFQPTGVGDKDREGVPGIIFRRSQGNQSNLSEHSYHENDFPALNVSGLDRSSLTGTPGYNQMNEEKSTNTSVGSLDDSVTSRVKRKERVNSADDMESVGCTSTPIRCMTNILRPSFSSLGNSLDSSQSMIDSPDISQNSKHSMRLCLGNTSKERSLCSTAIENSSRRRSKIKVYPSPDEDEQSFNSLSKAGNDSFFDSSQSSFHLGGSLSWSDCARRSPALLTVDKSETTGNCENDFPRLSDQRDVNSGCNSRGISSSGNSWSNVVRAQSPSVTSDTAEKSERQGSGDAFSKQGTTNSSISGGAQADGKPPGRAHYKLQSPVAGAISSEAVSGHPFFSRNSPTSAVAVRENSLVITPPWASASRNSSGSGQHKDASSPKPGSYKQLPVSKEKNKNLSRHSSPTPENLQPSPEFPVPQEMDKSHKGKGGTRSRNRKSRNGNHDSTNDKLSPSDNGSNQNKKSGGNPRRNPRNGPAVLTLESFMTPQKYVGRKAGAQSGKKDINMLHSRFVEELEANPISPPKKVRPSPIKRLSFSQTEEDDTNIKLAVSDGGDNKEKWHDQSNRLHNLKQIVEIRGDMTKSGDAKPEISVTKEVSTQQQKGSTGGSRAPVLSLEKYLQSAASFAKDVFEEENEDEDECPEEIADTRADRFWQSRSEIVMLPLPDRSRGTLGPVLDDSEEEDEECVTPLTRRLRGCSIESDIVEGVVINGIEQADPLKVTYKGILKKYARRYCHFVEEHQVPNIAVELYFVVQLLTCTEVDKQLLKTIDDQCGGTYFRSIHNGVYFAVTVLKRLRRLFAQLDKTYLELLASMPRIQVFSPKLHQYILKAAQSKPTNVVDAKAQLEHTSFDPTADGTASFPDANSAHVFKCQRENFYAFYGHYHDTSSAYEFRIENQIQYVFDGCTPEQMSLANLLHLAKLFLDHMILCCLKQDRESVDIIKMIQCKGQDEQLFTKLYEAFLELSNVQCGSACPSPGFKSSQMFFKDFIETLSCPAFNEHLRNFVVMRILELNSTRFDNVTDLHSSAAVKEDTTPSRNEKFSETIRTLCILGKLLGYLTFSPYNSGSQPLPFETATTLMTMREMTPLPLPLPLLLKQAFDNGHLCQTVPWIVEYLSMMDHMALQISAYWALLRKLHFIQRFAWEKLYKEGHLNSGLLIVSSISWLFEAPAVPAGIFFSCSTASDEFGGTEVETDPFQVDRQKLVSQQLLSSCCPFLEQGRVLLTVYSLKQKPVSATRNVIPLSHPESVAGTAGCGMGQQEDIFKIEQWLGTSLNAGNKHKSLSEKKRATTIVDDEVVPAYVLTRLISRKDADEMEDLELHFLMNNPSLKFAVETVVELMCSKVTDFTHRKILKLLVFGAKVEVRKQFLGLTAETDTEVIKDKILAQVNLMSSHYSEQAQQNFSEMCAKICEKELSDLLNFLTSTHESDIKLSANHVAHKMVLEQLEEWAKVQLGPGLFKRVITKEAEKCVRTSPKHLTMYPSDFAKKSEEEISPQLEAGFTDTQQLSQLIDKALSHCVWYINALTPGTRPDSSHMIQLILDFTNCVEKRMIPMDFAFYVMSNFLMHLIIQYMVDAPQNWTDEAADSFVKLCHLCKERKLENDRVAVKMPEVARKKKPMKIKVLNLMSVHAVQWLTKSEVMNETLMTYCSLIHRLVKSELLDVETVVRKLIHTRDNRKLDIVAKKMVNKVVLKVLEMLCLNKENEDKVSPKSFSQERVAALVEVLAKQLLVIAKCDWDEIMHDVALRLENTFGYSFDARLKKLNVVAKES